MCFFAARLAPSSALRQRRLQRTRWHSGSGCMNAASVWWQLSGPTSGGARHTGAVEASSRKTGRTGRHPAQHAVIFRRHNILDTGRPPCINQGVGLPSGPDRTRGVVEHSELQPKRSNPNARRQLGVRKEAAPSPPNHGGDGFLTCRPICSASSRIPVFF